jgi:hypothetical protein
MTSPASLPSRLVPLRKDQVAVIDLLGLVVFGTIVGIGLLDGRSGLTVFARYRSVDVTDLRRRVAVTERRGGGNQPMPPTPAK